MSREATIIRAVLWSAAILVVVLAAWISGHPLPVALIALALYATWQVFNVLRLRRWLRSPNDDAPRSFGAWARIFGQIESMQQKKRRSKKQYRMVIEDFETLTDAYPDATLVLDKKDRINWFNSAAGSLLGLDSTQDRERSVKTVIPVPEFIEWLENKGKSRKRRLEIPAPFQDDVWLEASSVPIRKKRRLIVLRDVTEVHHVERLRRDFVTNVSHELRTPLTVMLGYLEIFQDRPPDEMTDALQRMHAQAVQMQFMLDDFLELSRLQSVEAGGDEEIVDIAEILETLQEQAEEISRGDHQLTFEVEEGLNLQGVDSDLESAFRNLVVNALKYTPEGGKVLVRWQDTEQGPCLSVHDTGIGIPRREIPRLTERFYRVGSDRGRKSGGTGLGLAIVKHVLNVHQARLEIESEVGVGSTFSCVFPPERRAI
jgi:two-component system phosphate regulon sensor histidine kinase PhoR